MIEKFCYFLNRTSIFKDIKEYNKKSLHENHIAFGLRHSSKLKVMKQILVIEMPYLDKRWNKRVSKMYFDIITYHIPFSEPAFYIAKLY